MAISGPARTGAASSHRPILCFSHLRWDFVFQRPQHLMLRFARSRPVFVFEEATFSNDGPEELTTRVCPRTKATVATPRIPRNLAEPARTAALRRLLDGLVRLIAGAEPVLWYYTPQMLPFSRHLKAAAIVYDCMDELANFRFASADLPALETELLRRADVVFTGGASLFQAKRGQHRNVHLFPSSVDAAHFAQARDLLDEPADQRDLPHPRLGFFGVIDERMDFALIAGLADARPDWTLVMVGPLAKVAEDDLPKRPNIHWLGRRDYDALPAYLSGWAVALMPFARNEATRFISPTKTPEYLAGGRPVVSTPIADVESGYGDLAAVRIARTAEEFIRACEAALSLSFEPERWRPAVDAMLAEQSWDSTFHRMDIAVAKAVANYAPAAPAVRTAGRRKPFDDLVVGAGFAGAVFAERLAAASHRRVLVVDRRPHIGGNAFDHHDAAGLLVHRYGPHIFHTNSDEIFSYLSRFTRWRPYEQLFHLRVRSSCGSGCHSRYGHSSTMVHSTR